MREERMKRATNMNVNNWYENEGDSDGQRDKYAEGELPLA